MKVAVVVLHYKVDAITVECVDKLLSQNNDNLRIIIVDNNSSNGSFEILRDRYQNNEKVYLVSIEYNLGFAKANDLGYQIAKHKFESEIILVINNDLFIDDTEFINKVIKVYKEEEFDILGPDIVNLNGQHQNPLKGCIESLEDVEKHLFMIKIKIFLLPVFYKLKKEKSVEGAEIAKKTVIGVPLHGACLIFGKNFVKEVEYPFYPDTFLFGEEDILYFRAKQNGLKMLYKSELVVRHMEDVSTKSIMKSSLEKRLFELRNSYTSLKILKKLMLENKNSTK